MAKIIICVNHDFTSSTGGCEMITKQIAENMTKIGHKCIILSKSRGLPTTENGIDILNCGSSPIHFMKIINKENPDFLLVYSDYFCFWPHILSKSQEIKCKKILFPVGFNNTISNPFGKALEDMLKNKVDQFKIVTHSNDYEDFFFCSKRNIPVSVIPNGVDLEEMKPKDFYFRQKYGIGKNENVLLCISNFYPGKGQEFLLPILLDLHKKGVDFFAIFISATTHNTTLDRMRDRFSKDLSKSSFKSKMLIDLPREDVIQSLFESNVFVFPSQKEVAPVVLLEAMAASLPWVSLEVGNVKSLAGGVIVYSNKDRFGNRVFTQETNRRFEEAIEWMVLDKNEGNQFGKSGREKIEKELNWEVISKQYGELFS